jgi:hypothetical protein
MRHLPSPFGDFFGHHWEKTNYVTLFDWEFARGTSVPETTQPAPIPQ